MNKQRKYFMAAGAFFIIGMIIADFAFAYEKYSPTAIHKAAHTGNIDLVREILLTKPDPDIRDSSGGTALHAAMFQKTLKL
jgi:ankyrin repeat protein